MQDYIDKKNPLKSLVKQGDKCSGILGLEPVTGANWVTFSFETL